MLQYYRLLQYSRELMLKRIFQYRNINNMIIVIVTFISFIIMPTEFIIYNFSAYDAVLIS